MSAKVEVKPGVEVLHYSNNISGEKFYLVRPETPADLFSENSPISIALRAPLRLRWIDRNKITMESEIFTSPEFTYIYFELGNSHIHGRASTDIILPIAKNSEFSKPSLTARRYNIRRQNGTLVARITHIPG